MDMPKLLIADASPEFRNSLSQSLSGSCIIRCSCTGRQTLELLGTFHPDILILDLLLPEIDGISLLHKARDLPSQPAVLALSSFTSPYVMEAMSKFNVYYLMAKPCDIDSIAGHVQDLSSQLKPAPVSQADIHSAVSNLLLSLGFATKLDGFHYLQAAIPLFGQDPGQTVTKELYYEVGKRYNKNPKQVERSIRNAIDLAWRSRQTHIWQQYFPTTPDGSVPRPTNRDFISRMADLLQRQLPQHRSA